ncbi:uncharacterized protein [Venturia canescens]|uniref:uncharacterized protein n=1 Tax=Venturia canescens TaxID=32260 RepID=UPI001C9C6DA0|nr:uncharacterized protein LOC122412112 [Venturia canescens]
MNKFGGFLITMLFVFCTCMADCPPRNVTVDLDSEKFSGEWFVVSATSPRGKTLSKCGRFFVNPTSSDALAMNYTARAAHQKSHTTFVVNVTLDDDLTGVWRVQGSDMILGSYKHRVIDVDYSSHCVMIVCRGDEGDSSIRDFLMIWSREKTLSPTMLTILKDQVESYIDKNEIRDVDHSDC